MLSPFSFEGRLRPLPYAAWSLAIFFSQHLAVFLAFKAHGQPLTMAWWFYVAPLRGLVILDVASTFLIGACAYLLIAAWALAALAFRRAADADVSEWIAAAAIAPAVQIPVILLLCCMPSRVADSAPARTDRASISEFGLAAATQGAVAGMALTLFAVAVGALLFGAYGYGMFVLSPFVIGATTAYVANRRQDFGARRTAQLVVVATALAGFVLIAVALEGIVCIILAAPLGLGAALVGGLFGRAVAGRTRRSATQTLSAVALLPIVFASEYVLPPSAMFDTVETISVAAPPERVWQSIVRMDSMDEPPALPFRLGVAYPLRGEVIDEGVGATRRGEFSTGIALERVTEWAPNRKLTFVVVSDVPAMRELSPYAHVHAPHVVGYFRTTETSFELVPRADGRTDIVERTSHELKLDPVLYWLPLARWVVHVNNARVLAHIQRQAERAPRP
jgi:uncharacterized membrane protein YhaH (DUF805 family)